MADQLLFLTLISNLNCLYVTAKTWKFNPALLPQLQFKSQKNPHVLQCACCCHLYAYVIAQVAIAFHVEHMETKNMEIRNGNEYNWHRVSSYI